jgi:excinuclease ABC subunit C
MIVSAIDNIAGLGPTRKKRLLKEFGSVKKMRELEEEQFLALPWLPEAVGKAVYARLHGLERATIEKS